MLDWTRNWDILTPQIASKLKRLPHDMQMGLRCPVGVSIMYIGMLWFIFEKKMIQNNTGYSTVLHGPSIYDIVATNLYRYKSLYRKNEAELST